MVRRGSRDSVLPPAYKNHLNNLFREIEEEFSHLYLENVRYGPYSGAVQGYVLGKLTFKLIFFSFVFVVVVEPVGTVRYAYLRYTVMAQ